MAPVKHAPRAANPPTIAGSLHERVPRMHSRPVAPRGGPAAVERSGSRSCRQSSASTSRRSSGELPRQVAGPGKPAGAIATSGRTRANSTTSSTCRVIVPRGASRRAVAVQARPARLPSSGGGRFWQPDRHRTRRRRELRWAAWAAVRTGPGGATVGAGRVWEHGHGVRRQHVYQGGRRRRHPRPGRQYRGSAGAGRFIRQRSVRWRQAWTASEWGLLPVGAPSRQAGTGAIPVRGGRASGLCAATAWAPATWATTGGYCGCSWRWRLLRLRPKRDLRGRHRLLRR